MGPSSVPAKMLSTWRKPLESYGSVVNIVRASTLENDVDMSCPRASTSHADTPLSRKSGSTLPLYAPDAYRRVSLISQPAISGTAPHLYKGCTSRFFNPPHRIVVLSQTSFCSSS